MDNEQPHKEILSELEEKLLPYTKDLAFVIVIADRSLTPRIAYTKNVTSGFALAIVQHLQKGLMAEVAGNEKN